MSFLEQGLKASGLDVFAVNLPSTFGDFDECLASFGREVETRLGPDTKVNCVSHSMGGLVARTYFSCPRYRGLVKSFVFIATPHSGSRLADIACRIPFYTRVFPLLREAVSQDCNAGLPRPKDCRIGVIAGSSNQLLLGRLLLPEASDGRVAVSSVEVEDADEFTVLPFGHHEIHHRPETLVLVENFIRSGSFGSVV